MNFEPSFHNGQLGMSNFAMINIIWLNVKLRQLTMWLIIEQKSLN